MIAPVINLFKSIDEALFFKNSWINSKFMFSGVQLIPFNSKKYIQVTNTPNGINLEDWTVKVVSLCSGEILGDITDSFMIESLTNSTNGNPQFVWSLKNIQQDFGWDLIYLQITQAVGETFFSQPFKITDIDSEKTSFIAYKYKPSEPYQTIQLATWYREDGIFQEITKYYEESTKSTVTTELTQNNVEFWRTELMSRNICIKFKEILAVPYLYVNSVRANLYESPELSKSKGQENFVSLEYTLSFHSNDIYKEIRLNAGDWLDTDFLSTDFLIYTEQ